MKNTEISYQKSSYEVENLKIRGECDLSKLATSEHHTTILDGFLDPEMSKFWIFREILHVIGRFFDEKLRNFISKLVGWSRKFQITWGMSMEQLDKL